MKMTTLLKATLAASILTTGGYATTLLAPAAHAQTQTTETAQSLKDYYSKTGYNYSNLSGHRYESDSLDFVTNHNTPLSVQLVGQDLQKFGEKNKDYTGLDVFVVPEGTSREATTKSIGGITQNNNAQKSVTYPELIIYKNAGKASEVATSREFELDKEKITLKELDFKLRQLLIKKYDLYKDGSTKGEIVIITGDEKKDRYTFELSKKLQTHRMSDVIDVNKIKHIEVEY